MSFYRPTSQSTKMEKESPPPPPKKNVGGIIFAVVAISIIVLVITGLIIWLVYRSRNSSTGTNTPANVIPASSCTLVLNAPSNVSVVYNKINRTATLSWQTVTGAERYRIYRKLEDPAVSKENFDQRIDTINNSYNFIDLPVGTHYFVVTSFSKCKLESSISAPAVFSPSCQSALDPLDPVNYIYTLQSNQCTDPSDPFALYDLTYAWESALNNSVFIFRGSGQQGAISDYFYLQDVDTMVDPNIDILLKCDGSEYSHYVQYIKDVQNAPVSPATMETSNVTNIGSVFTVNWAPIAGAEMYAVSISTFDPSNGVLIRRHGGFATAPQTSLSLAVNAGDNVLDIKVRAFRICNQSPVNTNAIAFVTPTIPPPPP